MVLRCWRVVAEVLGAAGCVGFNTETQRRGGTSETEVSVRLGAIGLPRVPSLLRPPS